VISLMSPPPVTVKVPPVDVGCLNDYWHGCGENDLQEMICAG
jgi:hypothetical protein